VSSLSTWRLTGTETFMCKAQRMSGSRSAFYTCVLVDASLPGRRPTLDSEVSVGGESGGAGEGSELEEDGRTGQLAAVVGPRFFVIRWLS
jgi:hypothetical protein